MKSKFKEFLNTILKINDIVIFNNNTAFDTNTDIDNYTKENASSIQWLFHSGMLFGSSSKWWGDMGRRKTEHEGVDITFYIYNTDIKQLNHNIAVPAIDDGIILNICDDFLGKSIIVEHSWSKKCEQNLSEEFKQNLPKRFEEQAVGDFNAACGFEDNVKEHFKLITIYSHLSLKNSLKAGMVIEENQVLGNIADTSMRKWKIPSHLHMSVAAISTKLPLNELNWNLFGNPTSYIYDKVIFINPLWL